jgi:hypothetical protein
MKATKNGAKIPLKSWLLENSRCFLIFDSAKPCFDTEYMKNKFLIVFFIGALSSLYINTDAKSMGTVASCHVVLEVKNSKTEKSCTLTSPCETVEIQGWRFPIGSKLDFNCDFSDPERKPRTLFWAELAGPVEKSGDRLTKGSRIYFDENANITSVSFGEEQDFRGHHYGKSVSISINHDSHYVILISSSNAQPFLYDGHTYLRIELDQLGHIKSGNFPTPQKLNDVAVVGDFQLFPSGNVKQATLAEDYQLANRKFKKQTKIIFADDGSVVDGVLAEPFDFNSILVRGHVMYDGHKLKHAELACPIFILTNYKVAGWTMLRLGDSIEFNSDGRIKELQRFDSEMPQHCDPDGSSIQSHPLYPSFWKDCNQTTDCQRVSTRCGVIAIHQKYTDKLIRLTELASMTRKCPKEVSKSTTELQCLKGHCE